MLHLLGEKAIYITKKSIDFLYRPNKEELTQGDRDLEESNIFLRNKNIIMEYISYLGTMVASPFGVVKMVPAACRRNAFCDVTRCESWSRRG